MFTLRVRESSSAAGCEWSDHSELTTRPRAPRDAQPVLIFPSLARRRARTGAVWTPRTRAPTCRSGPATRHPGWGPRERRWGFPWCTELGGDPAPGDAVRQRACPVACGQPGLQAATDICRSESGIPSSRSADGVRMRPTARQVLRLLGSGIPERLARTPLSPQGWGEQSRLTPAAERRCAGLSGVPEGDAQGLAGVMSSEGVVRDEEARVGPSSSERTLQTPQRSHEMTETETGATWSKARGSRTTRPGRDRRRPPPDSPGSVALRLSISDHWPPERMNFPCWELPGSGGLVRAAGGTHSPGSRLQGGGGRTGTPASG